MSISIHLMSSITTFSLQWQSSAVVIDTVWPTKSKIFTLWPFTKMFAEPCPVGWWGHKMERTGILESLSGGNLSASQGHPLTLDS